MGMKDHLLAQSYFSSPAPKSTDAPSMIRLWETAPSSFELEIKAGAQDDRLALCDRLATACLISAWSIQRALFSMPKLPDELVVSGGGAANRAIMSYLRFEFPVLIIPTSEIGIPSEAREAVGFALLGAATLDGLPSNVPSATGARRAVVLGSITPKP
jgi:anhydro-N-acetylmuramic acid kinase